MEELVSKVGQSPWTAFIGLILSALPIIIWTALRVPKFVAFATGIARDGLKKQISKQKRSNIRTARKSLQIDYLIEHLIFASSGFIFSCFYLALGFIFFCFYITEKYKGIIPDPIWPIKTYSALLMDFALTVLILTAFRISLLIRMKALFKIRSRMKRKLGRATK